jgi:hypothetical protein
MSRALVLCVAFVLLGTSSVPAQDWLAGVFPEQSFDFGTVARGSKVRHVFKVVNTTNQEIHIADSRAKCGCTDVRIGARVIPPGTQSTIEATIDTAKFQGYKASGLVLVLDRPQLLEVNLNLTCFIRDDVRLSPGQVDFGVVQQRSKPTLTLTLSYLGGQSDWAVTKMQTISPQVSARLRELEHPPGSPAQYQLTATLDPSLPNGFFKDEITLLTNDPSSPRIPISVSANVQSAVTVSPSTMYLGRVKPGQVIKKTVLVRSNQPFKVTAIKAKGAELSATAPPEVNGPVHTLTVTFKAPTQTGPYNATLEIETDLKDEPTARLPTFATIVP